MSSEKTNSIFNKLYANRIVFKREGATIVNLSLLFCIIAFLTAPWLVIGGAIMISLGIIGHYIARIYDEVKNRPRYIVAHRTEEERHAVDA